MVIFIGGLSGAGKTTLGEYVGKHSDFCWVELDGGLKSDEVCRLKIRAEWNEFLCGRPTALGARFPGQTVFTLPSKPIIRPPMYLDSTDVRIRYLVGPKELCFPRAKERSKCMTQQYWNDNNKDLLEFLNTGCPVDWKIPVFTDAAEPRSLAEIAQAVLRPL